MRCAALDLPLLELQLVLRDRPSAREKPLVLTAKRRGQDVVVTATPDALERGAILGETASQAAALVPGLLAVASDPRRCATALRSLGEALLALAPVVELAGPEALLLDAAAARLVTPPEREKVSPATTGWQLQREKELWWAEAVLACVAEAGLDGRVAIAETPEAARLLAAELSATPGAPKARAVPPGHGPPAVGAVSLSTVSRLGAAAAAAFEAPEEAWGDEERPLWPALRPETLALIDELGIKRLARLRELPPRTLLERLGRDAQWLLALAEGGQARPLRPHHPPQSLDECREVDGWVESAEALVFALRPLAERLSARLGGRGLVAAKLRVTLETEVRGDRDVTALPEVDPPSDPGAPASLAAPRRGRTTLALELARPTAQPRILLDLLRERFSSFVLAAPVVGVTLSVAQEATRRDQLTLGERPRTQEALDSVLTRLRERLGEGCVGALEATPLWVPERATTLVPFHSEGGAEAWREGVRRDPPSAPEPSEGPFDGLVGRPTRLFQAEPMSPQLGTDGRPSSVTWRGRRHRVVGWTMPERLSTAWWDEAAGREYVTFLLGDGARVWSFRDGAGAWWVQGVHD